MKGLWAEHLQTEGEEEWRKRNGAPRNVKRIKKKKTGKC